MPLFWWGLPAAFGRWQWSDQRHHCPGARMSVRWCCGQPRQPKEQSPWGSWRGQDVQWQMYGILAQQYSVCLLYIMSNGTYERNEQIAIPPLSLHIFSAWYLLHWTLMSCSINWRKKYLPWASVETPFPPLTGNAQMPNAKCPNAQVMNLRGASLRPLWCGNTNALFADPRWVTHPWPSFLPH